MSEILKLSLRKTHCSYLISLWTGEDCVGGQFWPTTCTQESRLCVCSYRDAFHPYPTRLSREF